MGMGNFRNVGSKRLAGSNPSFREHIQPLNAHSAPIRLKANAPWRHPYPRSIIHMSALARTADASRGSREVRFVPNSDITPNCSIFMNLSVEDKESAALSK